ncbi:hypothetical protein Btru_061824 [Bulinus truncatus]|nr:hypothetical protein Btru_061824 [Bulinus truncatus]
MAFTLEDLVDHFLSPPYNPSSVTLTPGQIFFEAEMMEDEEEEKLHQEILHRAGDELKALGDAFFFEHSSTAAPAQQALNFDALVERLRSFFNQFRRSENNHPPRAYEQEAEAYTTFNGILLNTISGNGPADVRKRLGAYMLCLDKLSSLDERAKDVARRFSVQYIQTELGIGNSVQLKSLLEQDESFDIHNINAFIEIFFLTTGMFESITSTR